MSSITTSSTLSRDDDIKTLRIHDELTEEEIKWKEFFEVHCTALISSIHGRAINDFPAMELRVAFDTVHEEVNNQETPTYPKLAAFSRRMIDLIEKGTKLPGLVKVKRALGGNKYNPDDAINEIKEAYATDIDKAFWYLFGHRDAQKVISTFIEEAQRKQLYGEVRHLMYEKMQIIFKNVLPLIKSDRAFKPNTEAPEPSQEIFEEALENHMTWVKEMTDAKVTKFGQLIAEYDPTIPERIVQLEKDAVNEQDEAKRETIQVEIIKLRLKQLRPILSVDDFDSRGRRKKDRSLTSPLQLSSADFKDNSK